MVRNFAADRAPDAARPVLSARMNPAEVLCRAGKRRRAACSHRQGFRGQDTPLRSGLHRGRASAQHLYSIAGPLRDHQQVMPPTVQQARLGEQLRDDCHRFAPIDSRWHLFAPRGGARDEGSDVRAGDEQPIPPAIRGGARALTVPSLTARTLFYPNLSRLNCSSSYRSALCVVPRHLSGWRDKAR